MREYIGSYTIAISLFVAGANTQAGNMPLAIISWLISGIFMFLGLYLQFFKRQKTAKLGIDDVVAINKTPGLSYRLRINNKSGIVAEDCKAQLIAIEFVRPHDSITLSGWPVSEYLTWVSTGNESVFIGTKSTADLVVVEKDEILSEDYVIAYNNSDKFRKKHKLCGINGGILMIVSISCKNCKPKYVVCLLQHDVQNPFIVKSVGDKMPQIKDYQ